jgi:transglutaminase-like putative cysteine protease
MIYHIVHDTTYHYSSTVSLCHNLAHLTARDTAWQALERHELLISVPQVVLSTRDDYFGNRATYFTVQEPHRQLDITAINVVRMTPRPELDPAATPAWEQVVGSLATGHDAETLAAYQFVFDSQYVQRDPALAAYAAPSFAAGRPLLEAVLDLTGRIHSEFAFDSGAGHTFDAPLTRLLELRRGVCQDFAHLQIGCLRSLGLAARYVSGYLLTDPPPGRDRLRGVDMSHAWVSVFCPPHGWIDVDPTNNLVPREKHISLAWGRDYDDVSPMKGVILGGGWHSLTVGVDVTISEETA